MTGDLTQSLVRIVREDGGTAGTGFLVGGDGLLVTCAHVVKLAGGAPGGTVKVAVPGSDEARAVRVLPESWREPEREDIAILRLEGDGLAGMEPVVLGRASGTADHAFKTYGFPAATGRDGMWGRGRLGNALQSGSVEVVQLSSTEVTTGFSGAPVLDTVAQRVVGMVTSITAIDEYGRQGETAFMTPTEAVVAACPALMPSDVCPYRGLDIFTEEHARYFFGRQEIIDRCARALHGGARFIALLGPSGSGKSSVIQAGLIPGLRRTGARGGRQWEPMVIRHYESPFDELRAAGLAGADDRLAPAMETWLGEKPGQSRLLLILDQFEEILAAGSGTHGEEFLCQLSSVLSTPLAVDVILVMRNEFYGRLAERAPDLLRRVEPEETDTREADRGGLINVSAGLAEEDVRAIVEEPARVVGLQFEDGLVDVIVEDALDEDLPAMQGRRLTTSTILPLLEFALAHLWNQRQDGVLTHAAYRKIGGVTGALARWADDTYTQLTWDRLGDLTRRTFIDLVQFGNERQSIPDSRRRRSLESLVREGGEREKIKRVIDGLADARLVVTEGDPGDGQVQVELIHDALLREWGQLRGWLREDRRFRAWQQEMEQRAEDWLQSEQGETGQRDDGRLLAGGKLNEARGWLEQRRGEVDRTVREFVEAGIEREQRERRAEQERERRERRRDRFLWQSAAVIIPCLIALIVLILHATSEARHEQSIAERQRAVARHEQQIALSRALAAESGNVVNTRTDLALLLAAEAEKAGGTVQATGALLTAIEESSLATKLQDETGNQQTAVAFSRDGKVLAAGGYFGRITLWSVQTRRPLPRQLVGNGSSAGVNTLPAAGGIGDDYVAALAFSPDGRMLAAVSQGQLKLWNVTTGQRIAGPGGAVMGEVSSVAFSPDGKFLAWGGDLVRLRRVKTGRLVGAVLTGPAERDRGLYAAVQNLAFTPDGRTLVSRFVDNVVLQWRVDTKKVVRRIRLRTGRTGYENNAMTTNGEVVAFGLQNGTIELWDATAGKSLGVLRGHTGLINSLAFSPDGKLLASSSDDETIRVWDVREGPEQGSLRIASTGAVVTGVSFSPDSRLVASVDGDGTIGLWPVQVRQPLVRSPRGEVDSALSVAFSRDGKLLAAGGKAPRVQLWTVRTGSPRGSALTDSRSFVNSVAFSPTRPELASASSDGTVQLSRTETGTKIWEVTVAGSGGVLSVAFSPKGRLLATGDVNGRIHLWTVETGRPFGSPTGWNAGEDDVDVAFSPDGKLLASWGAKGTIRLWNVATEVPVGRPLAISGGDVCAGSVAFSPDWRFMAAGFCGRGVELWDLRSTPVRRGRFSAEATSMAFSPDGGILAMWGTDSTIRLWDVKTREPLGPALSSEDAGSVESIAFNRQGTVLAAGGDSWPLPHGSSAPILLWDVDEHSWAGRACSIAKRNLTGAEWRLYVGGPYHKTCPGLRSGEKDR